MGGTPWGWLQRSRGSIVLCGSFWWVDVLYKPHNIEIFNFTFPKMYDGQKNSMLKHFSKMMTNLWQLITVYSQNNMISMKYLDFWPKMYLILYPSLRNLTTHITIEYSRSLSHMHWQFPFSLINYCGTGFTKPIIHVSRRKLVYLYACI